MNNANFTHPDSFHSFTSAMQDYLTTIIILLFIRMDFPSCLTSRGLLNMKSFYFHSYPVKFQQSIEFSSPTPWFTIESIYNQDTILTHPWSFNGSLGWLTLVVVEVVLYNWSTPDSGFVFTWLETIIHNPFHGGFNTMVTSTVEFTGWTSESRPRMVGGDFVPLLSVNLLRITIGWLWVL